MTLEGARPEGGESERTAGPTGGGDASAHRSEDHFPWRVVRLALLTTAYVAGEIVLPMVFAFTLKLLLQPFFRILERLRIPRAFAALLLI